MLRAFIAIELPVDLQIEISQLIERLQKKAGKSSVRWVSTENIHLTLKFLGDIPSSEVAKIQDLLIIESARHQPITLEIGKLEAFPGQKRPRVILLGVDTPIELASLQRGLETTLAKQGYPIEQRPFSPHLTLGRVRETASISELASLTSSLIDVKIEPLEKVLVDKIHLFKSDLKPGGSVYTKLLSAQLSHST